MKSLRILIYFIYLAIITLLLFASCEKIQERDGYSTILQTDISPDARDNYQSHPFSLNDVYVSGDELIVNVSFSGGCKDHIFELQQMALHCGTPPVPPTNLALRHNSQGDMCEAYITETLKFDISFLKDPLKSEVTFVLNTIFEKDQESFTLTYSY